MKCRKDIIGRKIWIDDDNAYDTRPPAVEIVLYRGDDVHKVASLDSGGDGVYRFPCLIVWKNKSEKYVYKVDEPVVPDGYLRTVRGYDIINTLENVIIRGTKTWDDNHGAEGYRPTEVTVRLLQNSVVVDSVQVVSPTGEEDTVEFVFGEVPFADENGVPYVYTVAEDPVEHYETVHDGFNLTNILHNIP